MNSVNETEFSHPASDAAMRCRSRASASEGNEFAGMSRRAEARIQMHGQSAGTWRPKFRFTDECVCRVTAPPRRYALGAAIGLIAAKFMIQHGYGDRAAQDRRRVTAQLIANSGSNTVSGSYV